MWHKTVVRILRTAVPPKIRSQPSSKRSTTISPHTTKTSPCVVYGHLLYVSRRWGRSVHHQIVVLASFGRCGDDGLSKEGVGPCFFANVTYFALQGFVIQNDHADQGGSDVEELYFLGDVFSDNMCTQGWGGAINAYNVKTLGIGENCFVDNLATGSNATGGGVLM